MANKGLESIDETLYLYSKEITEGAREQAQAIAEKAAEKLKSSSPKRTGRYARNWKSAEVYSNKNTFRYAARNAGKTYRLTHLLEHGHASRNGGRIEPKEHIKPVEEWAIKEYEKALEKVINEAGRSV